MRRRTGVNGDVGALSSARLAFLKNGLRNIVRKTAQSFPDELRSQQCVL